MSGLTPRKRAAFTLVMLLVPVAGAAGLAAAYLRFFRPLPSGVELNQLAWEASFLERGLPVPPSGPREGYWGSGMAPWVEDPELEWREAEAHIPGQVESDANGEQALALPGARQHLLVIGGSVAWGSYASSIDTTWFAALARTLAARGRPLRVTVLAAGAWWSRQELAALRRRVGLQPDLVLFLGGLNDLAMREVPEDQRVNDYLDNLRAARDLCRARGTAIAVALQPFLLQKPARSRIEERVIELSLDEVTPAPLLRRGYVRLRTGLTELAREPGTFFVDCSGAFDEEKVTTFTDLWHFADPGHRLLAECLARRLEPALASRERPQEAPRQAR
jgi:lysophospholipase L1-like esterase